MSNCTAIPIYHKDKVRASEVGQNTTFIISYKLANCWQIIDTNTGCVYTPQAFETKFGILPPCPPSASRKTRKLWTTHRHQLPKGFKPKNNPPVKTGKKVY